MLVPTLMSLLDSAYIPAKSSPSVRVEDDKTPLSINILTGKTTVPSGHWLALERQTVQRRWFIRRWRNTQRSYKRSPCRRHYWERSGALECFDFSPPGREGGDMEDGERYRTVTTNGPRSSPLIKLIVVCSQKTSLLIIFIIIIIFLLKIN